MYFLLISLFSLFIFLKSNIWFNAKDKHPMRYISELWSVFSRMDNETMVCIFFCAVWRAGVRKIFQPFFFRLIWMSWKANMCPESTILYP